jgi:hypothetical protein
MPIYPFICHECGWEIEMHYKVDAEHISYCRNCSKPMVKNFKAMLPSIQYEQNDSVDIDLTGKPIVYHTKGQLKEIARQHGCTAEKV